ncbi:hypothetical protein [Corynebacterium anserum]|uniref:Uncharacterized protein n=1 Tax=Corynebacterium anserum TaxID=2684406 RepID=A0A7G7YPE7_9CORY|nr:hypothetical protein [Corynebacterium anserum]MBC2681985.1 hypothetical protein [Corynebacterium anserum]QNH96367.1 hypothetical protein GP473_06555 [Corynebacterium anserum]
MASKTYTAAVTREGRYWLATVTNLDGVNTWAYSFSHLDACVREAITLAEALPDGAEDAITVKWIMTSAPESHEEQ